MVKQCAFTIVAKNYIGLAQILERSIRRHDNELDFYIVVVDEIESELRQELPDNIVVAREQLGVAATLWSDMSFRYNLTEFCTSIKPVAFRYLFVEQGYEKCVYLDPDIYFFDRIGKIYEILDHCEILLTPHLTRIELDFSGDYSERGIMQTGVFNLGFCGLKRGESSLRMLNWWYDRLVTQCFNDLARGLFTDQKWMDLMPCYFSDQLKVDRSLGMNVAPWNFHERQIVQLDSKSYGVCYRDQEQSPIMPLIFVHYSGFNYRKLQAGSIEQKNVEGAKRYDDIDLIMNIYTEELQNQREVFDHFITQKYSYNYFVNGESITSFHRKLYVGLTQHGRVFEQPFAVDEGSFYQLLKRKKAVIPNGQQVEKILKKEIRGVDKKLSLFNRLSRVFYHCVGVSRYLLVLRLLAVFVRPEHQIHLLDKKYDTTNIN